MRSSKYSNLPKTKDFLCVDDNINFFYYSTAYQVSEVAGIIFSDHHPHYVGLHEF